MDSKIWSFVGEFTFKLFLQYLWYHFLLQPFLTSYDNHRRPPRCCSILFFFHKVCSITLFPIVFCVNCFLKVFLSNYVHNFFSRFLFLIFFIFLLFPEFLFQNFDMNVYFQKNNSLFSFHFLFLYKFIVHFFLLIKTLSTRFVLKILYIFFYLSQQGKPLPNFYINFLFQSLFIRSQWKSISDLLMCATEVL